MITQSNGDAYRWSADSGQVPLGLNIGGGVPRGISNDGVMTIQRFAPGFAPVPGMAFNPLANSALGYMSLSQTQIETISIGPDDDIERRRHDIVDAVGKVSDGSGVIILTDMFGGTPSNLAISVMETGKTEVIAGVNLPMLIKLASVRGEKPLNEAITDAQEAGRKYINVASQVLNGK